MRNHAVVSFLAVPAVICAQTYVTNFPLTETPISEGGKWINGLVVGKDWTDVKTASGRACGMQPPPDNTADNTALLAGTWGPDQTVTVTVYNQLSGNHSYPEMEIRLRSSLSANSCTGYEIDYSVDGQGLAIVRWNGPHGNYTVLSDATGSFKTGDVLKGTIIGNVITAYVNGTQVLQATDTKYKTGSPGMGFDQAGGSADMSSWGFTSFSVTATGATGIVIESSAATRGVSTFPPMMRSGIFDAAGRLAPAGGARERSTAGIARSGFAIVKYINVKAGPVRRVAVP